MRQYKFKDQQDVIDRHDPEQVAEFSAARERLRASNVPGSKKLLKNLEQAKERSANFLESLAEFNIAHLLLKKAKRFKYEPPGGDDFVWDDYVMSVKSIQPKEYEAEEDAALQELERLAKESGRLEKTTLERESSEAELIFDPRNSSSERIETGSEPLWSDLKYGGPIMQYMAEFEEKACSGKKIMFFFAQAQAFENCLFDDIAQWYFGLSHPYPIFATSGRYESMFKTRKNVIIKNERSIRAMICMHRPANALVWPPNCGQDEHRGVKRLRIFGTDTALMRDLWETFAMSGPAEQ